MQVMILIYYFIFWVVAVGYQAKACPDAFGTSIRAMEEEVLKKVDTFANMLLSSAEECEDEGVIYGYTNVFAY